MQKKKIAIFGVKYFPSIGGTSRVVESLLLELKDQYDFTIYCYKHENAENHIPGVRVIQFAEMPFGGLGVFMYLFRCCIHLLFGKKYDLVHVHKTDAAFFLPLLTQRFPTIVTSHALPYMNDKWSVIGKTYFRLVENIFMRTKAFPTSISRPQADYYEKKYKRPVHYIPNGVEPAANFDFDKVDRLLADHGVTKPFILFAARRVIPLKGAHHMIEALKRIDYTGTVVIAGDIEQVPAYTKKLEDSAEGLDLKFVGYVSPLPALFALVERAALFVFPSELEGMSMMLLEVGSVGTPMVCSDIPQNTAVFGEEDVLYFQTQNPADLAEKLKWAFNHPQEMAHMAEEAKNKVMREFSMEAVAERYAELYDNFLMRRKSYAV